MRIIPHHSRRRRRRRRRGRGEEREGRRRRRRRRRVNFHRPASHRSESAHHARDAHPV
jgi:hypothetical protein